MKKDEKKMPHRLQRGIPYQFSQVKLLRVALTHSSYANEQQTGAEHNERLEFLGDAVLELCVSEELFRRFPDAREGQLTAMRSKLVNQDTLAALARKMHLPEHLILGKGEEGQGGRERDSLLSDVFESVLGAVFLDGGFAAARKVVEELFLDLWPAGSERKKNKDPKSRLQELTQQRFKERPIYVLAASSGPEHDKQFIVRLTLPDGSEFTATGSSLKRAEQTAAEQALARLSAGEPPLT